MIIIYLLLGALLSVSGQLFAQEIPESFVPVRPHAMGGAFTAIANDEEAVFTNPAGIARVRKARSRSVVNMVKIPNVVVGANSKSKEFIESVSGGTEASDLEDVAAQADTLGDRPFWSHASAFPLIMFDLEDMPALLGAFSSTTIRSVINDESPDLANTEAISDVGGAFALAFTNKSNRFNFGITTRYLARYAYEDKIPVEEFTDVQTLRQRIQDSSNKSTALAIDMGLLWTLADFWFPTFGIAVLNAPTGCRKDYLNPFSKLRQTICGTVFSGNFANKEALSTVDPTDVRIGFSITPRFGNKLAARIALDLHHLPIVSGDKVYGLDGIDPIKLLHAGFEIFSGNPLLPSPFSVAVGLNQGYYTAGFTARLPYFTMNFASYGQDISDSATPKEDRRYLGGLSLQF